MFNFVSKRKRFEEYNNLDNAVELIKKSKKIVIVTGAGISVSCGIPDFRSKGGLYDTLSKEGIDPPESIFDLEYFEKDPSLFYSHALSVLPFDFQPSKTHKFIAELDKRGKLLNNYTQNIDNLESVAGVKHLIQCHGSLGGATCLKCHKSISIYDIEEDVRNKKIAHCKKCSDKKNPGVLKPDVVFFGENLPSSYFECWEKDRKETDLLIIIGTSLNVTPVAMMPLLIQNKIPQILINRESLGGKDLFDIKLLGDCDDIIDVIEERLGWKEENGGKENNEKEEKYNIEFIEPNITKVKKKSEEEKEGEEKIINKLASLSISDVNNKDSKRIKEVEEKKEIKE